MDSVLPSFQLSADSVLSGREPKPSLELVLPSFQLSAESVLSGREPDETDDMSDSKLSPRDRVFGTASVCFESGEPTAGTVAETLRSAPPCFCARARCAIRLGLPFAALLASRGVPFGELDIAFLTSRTRFFDPACTPRGGVGEEKGRKHNAETCQRLWCMLRTEGCSRVWVPNLPAERTFSFRKKPGSSGTGSAAWAGWLSSSRSRVRFWLLWGGR